MYAIVSKLIMLLFFVYGRCQAIDLKVPSGAGNAIKDIASICINLFVFPRTRLVFNYSNTFYPQSESVQLTDGIRHYLLDSFGNQILSSTKNTSRICYNPSDTTCRYFFLGGHGGFRITDDDLGDNIILEGELEFGKPKLIRIMANCIHYCGKEDHQIVFVGEKSDKPDLYSMNNIPGDSINEVVFDRTTDEQHIKYTFDSKTDQIYNENDEISAESQSLVMRTACLKPRGCYKLVGSSVYIVTRNSSQIEEEGTTYDGYKTIGPANHACHQRCHEKPLLVDTKRGQEITLVLSSISGMSALADVNSPQYLAACWLIHDDRRRLPASHNANVVQRYVLALLFFTLGGSEWTSNYDFLTPKHECEWRKSAYHSFYGGFFSSGSGVQCYDSDDVSSIILVGNNLLGSIPSELSWLLQIEYLDLSQNLVYGTIPPQVGNLRNLRQLRLSGNQLTGSIPQTLGEIESLMVMDLSNNKFQGSMISNAGGNLVLLSLMNNMISGTIPNEIGTHTSLAYYSLSHNLFTGTIPESFSRLSQLEYLVLEGNSITGSLPSQIFMLPSLSYLKLSELSLSGTVPNNVNNESALNLVHLDGNQLTGTIPSEFSLLGNLQRLLLQNNALTGKVPLDFIKLEENIMDFRFQNNDISGIVPFENCHIPQLEADCDSPQKVSCDCCTQCHGIFSVYEHDVSCPSRELQIAFDGLQQGDSIEFQLLANDRQSLDWYTYTSQEVSHTYHKCISTSSCYKIIFPKAYTSYPFEMKVLISEEIILEELVTEQYSFDFGFSLDEGSFKKGTCDSFKLCGVAVEANSAKRRSVDRLTQATGINVFEDVTSPYYIAACEWMVYLNGKDDDQLKLSATLQYFFLSLFYLSTNGDEWINSDLWLTNDSYCSWYGISCDEHDIVTAMNLSSNNLVGSIITEIGKLRGLERIMLGNNSLSGTIPVEIGLTLNKLKHLNISSNALRGKLPPEIGLLTNLAQIDLSFNYLADTLPSAIGTLGSIQLFNLFGNTLAGGLPVEFSYLTNLKLLSLGSNVLTGDVSSVKRFCNLEILDLSDNFFTGTLPLGDHQRNLRVFQLSGNQFVGSISSSIEQLSSLEELYLYNNQLTGNLPSQLGNLDKLTHVSLSYNMIKGFIPSAVGQLKRLTLLHLHNTDLQGNGDFFVHPIGEYVTDCGNTITSPAKVLCSNCSSCCNVGGDCLRKDVTWPGEIVPPQISGSWFVILTALGSSVGLVIIIFVHQCFYDGKEQFGFCEEFQEESIYKYFLSDNAQAQLLASATVALQTLLLYIFIAASDFTATRNDWEYSMSCPYNSIACENRRSVTPLAWFALSLVLFSFLMKDLLQSVKMINESARLRFWKGVLAGFIVFFITMLSIAASTLYNYSTGITDTDILKDAVILLFLNDIDEQLYTLVELAYPSWVAKRNRVTREYLESQMDMRDIKKKKKIIRFAHADKTESMSANADEETPSPDLQTGSGVFENMPEIEEHCTNMKSDVAQDCNKGEDKCDLKNDMNFCKGEITDLKNGFTQLENNHVQLVNDYCRLQNDYFKLMAEHTYFMDDYMKLKEDYTKLQSNYSVVKDEICEIKKELHLNASK